MLTTEYTWDCFYSQHHDQREWYLSRADTMSTLKNLLSQYLPDAKALSILHSGCGTSDLCVDLDIHLVENARVTNTDFSQPVVDLMTDRHPRLHFVKEDARAMTFVDGSFHLIVDKGTLDAASSNSELSEKNVTQILEEYHRVLRRPQGIALIFSLYGNDEWAPALAKARDMWDVQMLDLECPENHPEHVMRTEEVGGRRSRMHLMVLSPREKILEARETREATDEREVREAMKMEKKRKVENEKKGGNLSSSSSSSSDDGDDSPRQCKPMSCLKCKDSDALFQCDPCGCLSYCKKCAMKVASGGKCKQCGQFYGGVRRSRRK